MNNPDLSLNQRQWLPYMQSAVEMLGLEPESIIFQDDAVNSSTVVAGNSDEIAHISFGCYTRVTDGPLSDAKESEYNLRGLLVDRSGTMWVKPKDYWLGHDKLASIKVISTHTKLATVMTQLGMAPGVDSLCPVEHETEKSFKAIPYLRELAVKNSAVSNRRDWYLYQHDIGIDAGHRPDLLTFSPEFVQVISDQAVRLLEDVGVDGVATLEMKDLVRVVDNFRFSRVFFQAVYDVIDPNRTRRSQKLGRNHRQSPFVELYRLINKGLGDLEDPEDHSQEEYANMLKELGLLERGLKRRQEIEGAREISLGFVLHSARLLLAVEDLVPNPNKRAGESQRRMLEKVARLA